MTASLFNTPLLHSLKRFLSKSDVFSLLEIMDASFICKQEDDFRNLLKYFGRLFGADFSFCLFASLNQEEQIASFDILNAGFPSGWLERYIVKKYYRIDPVAIENFRHYKVQYWENTYKKYNPPTEVLYHLCRFGLKQGYSCGVKHSNGKNGGSFFSFSGDSLEKHPRTEIILKYSVPLLHRCFTGLIHPCNGLPENALTVREKEIIRCVKDGKKDMEIASQLRITEHTVKFHVKNILYKLNASNRYHALSLAIQRDLIEL
jgi:LuxR family transcriptional activator of bioluminescence operon